MESTIHLLSELKKRFGEVMPNFEEKTIKDCERYIEKKVVHSTNFIILPGEKDVALPKQKPIQGNSDYQEFLDGKHIYSIPYKQCDRRLPSYVDVMSKVEKLKNVRSIYSNLQDEERNILEAYIRVIDMCGGKIEKYLRGKTIDANTDPEAVRKEQDLLIEILEKFVLKDLVCKLLYSLKMEDFNSNFIYGRLVSGIRKYLESVNVYTQIPLCNTVVSEKMYNFLIDNYDDLEGVGLPDVGEKISWIYYPAYFLDIYDFDENQWKQHRLCEGKLLVNS